MKKTFLSISLLAAMQLANAQTTDRSIRPQAGPAPEIKMGDAQTFTLPNGLKVFVVENHKLPTVSYTIDFDIQPALQGKAVGYKNLVGELMKTGTKTRNSDKFNTELDNLGATINAGDDGIYAQSLSRNQDKMLTLLSDMLLNPNFTQAELNKLKTESLAGIKQQQDDPAAMGENLAKALVYGSGHAYGEVPTETSINNITLDMCKKYFSTYFRPNVAYLAVVGDITLDEAKKLVSKNFASWQKAAVPKASYTTPKANDGARVAVVNKTGAVQSIVDVTYPINLKPGTPDVIKLKVANAVLGGGSAGRLFQNLRETHGWTYGSYSSVQPDILDNAGTFSATAKCRTAVTDSSVGEILKEMNRLRSEKVDESTINAIKKNMAGKFALGLEDPKTLARYAINIDKDKMPKDYYKSYLKNLDAVNATDVQTVAQKYITPGVAAITVAGDKEEIAPKLKAYAKNGVVEEFDMYGNPAKNTEQKVAAPANIKAEDIINNYITAVGGLDNWNNVKDVTIKMGASIQGQNIVVNLIKKAPNKSCMEVSMGGNVMQKKVYDGSKGFQSMMGQTQDMTGKDLDDAKEEANYLNESSYLDASKYKMEVRGIENIDGANAYAVKVTNLASNTSSMQYYDVATKLKLKEISNKETPRGPLSETVTFADYKDVKGGLKYPFSIKQAAGPQVMDFKVESVLLNTNVSDDIFVKK